VELLHFAGPDTQLVVACLERPILNDELVTEDVDELAEREDLAIRRCGKVAIRIFATIRAPVLLDFDHPLEPPAR
jgi:hypothetical protein